MSTLSTETISGHGVLGTSSVRLFTACTPYEIGLNMEYHSGRRKADSGARKKMIRNDIRLLIYMKHDGVSN